MMWPEVVELVDMDRCDGRVVSDEVCVRGHVPDVAATVARRRWWQGRMGPDPMPAWGSWRRRWARWSMEATCDGPGHVIRYYDAPGAGRWPVTWCETRATMDARAARLAHVRAVRDTIARTCPGAEVRTVDPGGRRARVMLPGGPWPVDWRDGDLWAQPKIVDSVRAYQRAVAAPSGPPGTWWGAVARTAPAGVRARALSQLGRAVEAGDRMGAMRALDDLWPVTGPPALAWLWRLRRVVWAWVVAWGGSCDGGATRRGRW